LNLLFPGKWVEDLIQISNIAGWWELSEQFGDQLASLVEVEPDELVIYDTTIVNFYKGPCSGVLREPNLIRFGVALLYFNSDVHEAVSQLLEVLEGEEWKADEFSKRGTVT